MKKKTCVATTECGSRIEFVSRRSSMANDTKILLRVAALLFAICLFSYLGAGEVSSCPHCGQKVEFSGTWRGNWVCPNKTCRYENMDGIDYCGLCGTWRYEK